MPATRTPPARWVEEGLRALAVGGPDAVRIEPLAQALGVTKGGFYGYFSGRRALLEEMLDTWERTLIDEVIERVEEEGGDARTRLRRLFALASSLPGGRLRVELAIRDWARRDKAVAKRLKRVDNRRMEFMRALFADFCRDARRRRGPLPARLLLSSSAPPSSPPITTGAAARMWWSRPWSGLRGDRCEVRNALPSPAPGRSAAEAEARAL